MQGRGRGGSFPARMARVAAAAMLVCALGRGADWLNEGGDPRRSNCQPRERIVTAANVKGLQLLWRRQLAPAGTPLSAPVILGRLPTHRGTVELIFVTGGSNVYAIDGDFGTVFWQRHIDGLSTAAPAIAPPQPGYNEEEDDDVPQPVRPVSVLIEGRRLRALHPADGRDLESQGKFQPAVARPRFQTATCGNSLWTHTAEGIAAYRGRKRMWRYRAAVSSGPVVAGAVVFAVAGGFLVALDAAKGEVLYLGRAAPHPTALAVANGHIVFAADGAVYCFGFPVG